MHLSCDNSLNRRSHTDIPASEELIVNVRVCHVYHAELGHSWQLDGDQSAVTLELLSLCSLVTTTLCCIPGEGRETWYWAQTASILYFVFLQGFIFQILYMKCWYIYDHKYISSCVSTCVSIAINDNDFTEQLSTIRRTEEEHIHMYPPPSIAVT